MLYQDYKAKINRRVKIRKTIRRFRVPIICTISAIIMLLASFMITKGMIFGDTLENNKIEYGNKPSFTASAVFSDVRYEFSSLTGGEWSTEVPVHMGEYKMRVVSNGLFGERYSDEQKFSIVPRKIDVVVDSDSFVYGELPGVSASLAFDDKVYCTDFTFEDDTQASTNVTPVKETVVVKDKSGKDVTGCYSVNVKPTLVTFEKRDITLTVDSASTEYNGEFFKHEVWDVTEGSLANGDDVIKIVEDSFSSIKGVGSTENKGEFYVVRNGIDITHLYNITQVSGTLTIEQKPIVVYTNGKEFTYTGDKWYDIGFELDQSTPLVDGHTISVSRWNEIVNVGEVENALEYIIRNQEDSDVTDNYSFTCYNGKLKVLPREVTVTTKTDTVEYDGQEHFFGIYEITSETKLALGHEFKIISQTSAINAVEDLENVIDLDIVDGNGSSVKENYQITYENGTVTVSKKNITVTSDDLNGTYNGRAQGAESATYDENELCPGHTLDITYKSSVTECLDEAIDNEFTVIIRDGDGNKVTDNYNVNAVYGKLKLSPLPIDILTGSAYKVYDGTPLSETSFEYIVGSNEIVNGHRVEYINETKLTDSDVVDNVLEIRIYSGDEDKSHNYEIYYEYGELFVDRRPIVITSLGFDTKIYYDGEKHTREEVTVTPFDGYDFALVDGHTVEVEFLERSYVDVANVEVDNIFNVVAIKNGNESVTKNYAPICVFGRLSLERRPVAFVSGTIEEGAVIYDGQYHYLRECKALDVDPDNLLANMGLVSGHTPVGIYYNSIVDAGEIDNEFEVYKILDANNNDVMSNYEIMRCEYGKLRVSPRPIILISGTDFKMYDGTELVNHSYGAGGMGMADGESLIAISGVSITDVLVDKDGNIIGIENAFDFDVVGGRGKKSNYVVTDTDFGTLTVTKRPITLTSQSATKVYDGELLYNNELIISGVGLANGQQVICVQYASLRDVVLGPNGNEASIINTFDVMFQWNDGRGVSATNYEITKREIGELKLNKRPVLIVINDAEREYNGLPLTPTGYQVGGQSGDTGLLNGHMVDLQLSGSITKVGSTSIGFGEPFFYTFGEDGVQIDKTVNYSYTITGGTLTVNKRQIILSGRYEEQEYTGDVIYPTFGDEDVIHATDPSVQGLGYGDSINVIITDGARTELGTSVVKIKNPDGWTITNGDGEDVTYCYEVIDVTNGQLKVIPRKITIKLDGGYKEYYDGAPVMNSGFTVGNFLYSKGHTISMSATGSQTDVGTGVATLVDGSVVIKDQNGQDASRYYEIVSVEDGHLVVDKKRHVKVTSAGDYFLYDGAPHKNETYSIFDQCPVPMQRDEEPLVTFTNGDMILPGTYENRLVVQMFVKGTSHETTNNYEFEYEYGQIVIGSIDIEIKTEGGEKVYDGAPLENPNTTYYCPNMPQGLDVQVIATGAQTDAGTSANTYEIVATLNGIPFPSEGFNVIKEELGELKVTPLEITVHTGSGEKTYDGTPLVHKDYTSDFEGTEASKNLSLSVETTMLTDIGRKDNTFTVDLIDKNGNKVSRDNFIVSKESTTGTLTMYADHIIIESDRDRFDYDGEEKSCPKHKAVNGHVNSYHTVKSYNYNSFVDVGKHENTFDVIIVDAEGNSMMEFYPSIEKIYDFITIEPRKIVIEAPTIVERYENGKVIYAPNEIVTPNEDIEELNNNIYGNEYSYEIDCNMAEIAFATEMGKDVEYYIPKEHFYITKNGERLKQENFEIECLPGYLKFSDKLVEIEVFEVIGYYDGSRLEYFSDDWDISPDQLPEGYWLDLDLSGIGLSEAGVIDFDEMLEYVKSSGRLFVRRFDDEGRVEDVTHMFEFKFIGTPLTMNKAELVLTAGSASKVHDGTPLTYNYYTITGGGLAEGHKIESCKIVGSITDVGKEDNTIIDVVIIDTMNKDLYGQPIDVTGNYHIQIIDGVLEVFEDEQE